MLLNVEHLNVPKFPPQNIHNRLKVSFVHRLDFTVRAHQEPRKVRAG